MTPGAPQAASASFRLFYGAILCHGLAWAALAAAAFELPDFQGGAGMVLAALHLLTLGVLTAGAMGALIQILPVAAGQEVRVLWPAILAARLFLPGVLVLAAGMAWASLGAVLVGGAVVALVLLAFAWLLVDTLRRARGLPVVVAHGWVAVAALVGVVGLGLVLALDWRQGLLAERGGVVMAHVIIAAYGFMGMLAMGFSYVLVPMFTLSPTPARGWALASCALAALAVAAAASGALAGWGCAIGLGCVFGLASWGMHFWLMRAVWKKRLRKRLGPSFLLVRISWIFMGLSLVLGALPAIGFAPFSGEAALFGYTLLVGWLLTLLLGVLQRVLPFLATLDAAGRGGKPLLVSTLMADLPARIHAGCHCAALVLVPAGIVLGKAGGGGWVILAGAGAGLAGATAFAVFAFCVHRRAAAGGVS